MNGKQFNMRDMNQLMAEAQKEKQQGLSFKAFFKSKNMRKRTMLLSINWLGVL